MRRRRRVPLRRRKACLAGTFALFAACALVLLIPHPAYAGIIGDFLDIPNMIKTWLLQIAATLFNTYFGVINQTLDAKFFRAVQRAFQNNRAVWRGKRLLSGPVSSPLPMPS